MEDNLTFFQQELNLSISENTIRNKIITKQVNVFIIFNGYKPEG